MKNYLDFISTMTLKELKARYKRAVFGFLWIVLNPILQMIIIGVIFSFFIKIENYFIFLFSGLLPWQFVSLSLSKATPSIVFERALLQKARFPIESIPVSIILANFVNMVISFALFFLVLVLLGESSFLGAMLSIFVLVWLLVFAVGLSLLTASLQIKYRDVNFFVQTFLVLWFYATPVLYNLSLIPRELTLLFSLNPLTSIFELLHVFMLKQGVLDTKILVVNVIESFIIVFVGVYVFRKQRKYFVDWL
jgi:ABC-type polysaccharide/polyol phosphate export permease